MPYWEHIKHEYPPNEHGWENTEGDYFKHECPECEKVNTLVIIREGVIRLQTTGPIACIECGTLLKCGSEVKAAIKNGPPKTEKGKEKVKDIVQQESPPEPEEVSDVIDPSKITFAPEETL